MSQDMRSKDQIEAGNTVRHIGSGLLDAGINLCARHSRDDGIFYLPFVVLAALKGQEMLCLTVHFDSRQPPDEVARLMRLAADQLEGKVNSEFWVERSYLQ
jgi:hypothetical protein